MITIGCILITTETAVVGTVTWSFLIMALLYVKDGACKKVHVR